MRITWYGHSAFLLEGREGRVFIDPFPPTMPWLSESGRIFRYPAIPELTVDVLLITHEHLDHNAAESVQVRGETIRSTAGSFATRIGEVRAVASEHDAEAGIRRGPNSIFVFRLDGFRIAHFGDFGQSGLRAEQLAAIGSVDIAMLPAGGGPTIDGRQAVAIGRSLGARILLPMHYRTPAIDCLEPVDAFLHAAPRVVEHPRSSIEWPELPADGPLAVVLRAPLP